MKWDDKAKVRLTELRAKGWSYAQLARYFNVSRSRVWQIAKSKSQTYPKGSKTAARR